MCTEELCTPTQCPRSTCSFPTDNVVFQHFSALELRLQYHFSVPVLEMDFRLSGSPRFDSYYRPRTFAVEVLWLPSFPFSSSQPSIRDRNVQFALIAINETKK